ncbi:hypothetical protein CONLIGDRAFT_694040 [Coniochaeta ligniaria NRRL 30616]|uniref:Uncharacterized protein n=1 Tax=Coniochaeta ligniaria NRRL 30616 TaxID=1408157 RepID=A0A1J7I6L0_9PEZI|nr:hypothetical protein CONLIGDRAFT_694040 [Coniochaeta ligniaria NRRL 30616]
MHVSTRPHAHPATQAPEGQRKYLLLVATDRFVAPFRSTKLDQRVPQLLIRFSYPALHITGRDATALHSNYMQLAQAQANLDSREPRPRARLASGILSGVRRWSGLGAGSSAVEPAGATETATKPAKLPVAGDGVKDVVRFRFVAKKGPVQPSNCPISAYIGSIGGRLVSGCWRWWWTRLIIWIVWLGGVGGV